MEAPRGAPRLGTVCRRAQLVSDWFSDEDRVYDDLPRHLSNRSAVRPGDLFLAPFHYADLAQAKRRPVCVVSTERVSDGPDVLVAMVTSNRVRFATPTLGDVPLLDWHAARSPRPLDTRAARLQAIETRMLQGQLGQLSARDLDAVKAALRSVLDLD